MSARECIRRMWAPLLFLSSLILGIGDDKKILTDDLADAGEDRVMVVILIYACLWEA